MAIAVNSLTGPAMVNLPATFARSGILPTLATLLFVCALSALCSLHMANTISKIPGNAQFQREMEYSDAFQAYWGRKGFLLTQVLFFCCIFCLNMSSIVDTGAVVDTFLGHWWPYGGSLALQVSDDHQVAWIQWDYSSCTQEDLYSGDCVPFAGAEDGMLFTAGTFLTTLIFLPLALADLEENAHWQILGFLLLLATSLQFVVQFIWYGLDWSKASWWGTDWDDLLGVVLFNFALVIAIPAWLYEREPHVDVPTIVHSSSLLSVTLYIAVGLLGSLALPNISDNMLESLMSGAMGPTMQIGASIFAFAIIGLGIPLFSVLTRLNLSGSGLCSRRVANLLAVYFPFACAWIVNDGKSITKLLSWGGMIFTSFIGFILPITLSMYAVSQQSTASGSIAVYFGWFVSKRARLLSLQVLLALAIIAIALAIAGNLI